MPFYGSCVLEHYGVLPGNPVALSVNGVSEKWAVISWKPPRYVRIFRVEKIIISSTGWIYDSNYVRIIARLAFVLRQSLIIVITV